MKNKFFILVKFMVEKFMKLNDYIYMMIQPQFL